PTPPISTRLSRLGRRSNSCSAPPRPAAWKLWRARALLGETASVSRLPPRRANRTSAEPCQLCPCPFRTNPDLSDRGCPETGVLYPVAAAFHRWSHPADAV